MNYFLLLFLLVVFIISAVIIAFGEEVRSIALDAILQFTATKPADAPSSGGNGAASAAEKAERTSAEPKWVPEGFIGPTGEPKIIGPSGNPPNY